MRVAAFVCVLLFGAFSIAGASVRAPGVAIEVLLAARPAPTLSAYRLFLDAGARVANEGVTPYALNTALYSDGALKIRHVFIPPGAQARYRDDGVFDFPVGTVLVKTFAFAADMRTPGDDVRYLETRLLIRQAEGWVARPYVWNAAQTEARYAPVSAPIPVDFIDAAGAPAHIDWAAPNQNQCRGCHDRDDAIAPIGPSARNLNGDFAYRDGVENQLRRWARLGLIDRAPENAPRAPDAFNPVTGSLAERARTYLDINCAHCHNPQGPARTSGLDLRASNAAPASWGVRKRPVAAGRASAGLEFAIAPGAPDSSILVHRMESLDPGVMMPELGRQTRDAEGVALVRAWIARMDADGHVTDAPGE